MEQQFVRIFCWSSKKNNNKCIVLQGGTNFPHAQDQQKQFLLERPNTDLYALFEGERSSLKVVERYLEYRNELKNFFDKPIDGCVFIDPKSREVSNPKLITGNISKGKDLDEIPSPYMEKINFLMVN